MPSVTPRPVGVETPSSTRLIGWGVYVVLVLVGFAFGVWAGNQRSKPPEVVRNDAPAAAPAAPPQPAPAAAVATKKDAPVAPKKETTAPTSPEKKGPTAPEASATPEPKKVPEPKKTPEPKPEPKPATPEPKSTAPVTQVSFTEKVLPIFRSKCLNCHGAAGKPKGGLDLRTVAAILKGGDGGPGVKAGDLKNSPVWSTIDDMSMPPDGKDPLTDAEKMIIRNWVLSGAK